MKLIDNKVEEYIQEPGIEGIYKAIASAARICYQTDASKMKIAPREFVENVLLKNGHSRPLEFGTVYMACAITQDFCEYDVIMRIISSPYTKTEHVKDMVYITTNMRVIMQGEYETDKEAHANGYDRNFLDVVNRYWCEPTEHHEKRYTFTVVMSRGCTDDLRTHVTLSSICESTRFCNYGKDKFGNELTFIKPYWIDDEVVKLYEQGDGQTFIEMSTNNEGVKQMLFLKSMESEEAVYLNMSRLGLQPQQLKRVFPLGVKAELRLCGFMDAWENFFWRRSDSHADPECEKVSNIIQKIFREQYGN